jgi:P27 family predicted phage terminase small subunit
MIKAPKHLTESSRTWWAVIVAEFDLEDHHLRLLTLAAEAWDRGLQARETLRESGAYYTNKAGEPRAHPGVAVERDCRIAYARLMRELDLDGYPEPDIRPPRIGSRT